MNRKTLLIAGGALVVGAFLLGFVPQYLKARDLDNQLSAFRQQLNSEQEIPDGRACAAVRVRLLGNKSQELRSGEP